MLFHFGPCWENGGQAPAPFRTFLVLLFCNGPKPAQWGLDPDTCISALAHAGKSWTGFQTTLEQYWPLIFEVVQIGPNGVWIPTPAFPLRSMREKVGPGSKPL